MTYTALVQSFMVLYFRGVRDRGASMARPCLLFCLLSSVLLTGCLATPKAGPESEHQTQVLRQQLLGLGTQVDSNEAGKVAAVSVDQAIELSHQYRAVRPAWLHNVLVNRGFRERGLCFHWANDLYLQLFDLHPKTLDLHLAVSKMDTKHEHNAIVVTARGIPFEQGLVLDGWRYSGRLWFVPVSTDTKYPWEPLPPDRFDPAIKKRLSPETANPPRSFQ